MQTSIEGDRPPPATPPRMTGSNQTGSKGDIDVPHVDIGMTTYKPSARRLEYLRTAVESILRQTFGDWRLLVSENGSEPGDGVARVLEPYLDDPRITHVPTRAELSGGENSTRATAGTAPYVTLLHDDDWWEPAFLERRVEFLDAHPDCGFVFGGTTVVDDTGEPLNRSRAALPEGAHPSAHYVSLLLRGEGIPMPPTALIRRTAFDAIGGAFDHERPGWDFDLYLRLGARFPVGYLGVWDSAFRVHPQQYTYAVRWGDRRIEYEDRIDEILGEANLDVAPSDRRSRRAAAYMMAALDAAETGARRHTLSLVGRGIRMDRRAALDRRVPVVLVMAAFGPRLGPFVNRVRAKIRRRRYVRRQRDVSSD
jgi:glycosyltransferase involved in cell wall biosynthesis